MFRVSVIIPVYNSESFLKEAIDSAIVLEDVGEIILVEDGSKDHSLEVCKNLEIELPKIKLARHPNGENRGAAASRNLGISMAKFDYIAFLDADDWYAKSRFERDRDLFHNEEVFATYSLSAVVYSSGKNLVFGTGIDLNESLADKNPITQYRYILENDLTVGHTNCNTIKKTVFDKIKGFDERLDLHQDTELWNRIARNYGFYAGNLQNPISFARRHSGNRITHKSRESLFKLQVVSLDNIGLQNLYDFEKNYVIYQIARVITSTIKNPYIRKSLLHGIQLVLRPVNDIFIQKFYKWGMKKYNLNR